MAGIKDKAPFPCPPALAFFLLPSPPTILCSLLSRNSHRLRILVLNVVSHCAIRLHTKTALNEQLETTCLRRTASYHSNTLNKLPPFFDLTKEVAPDLSGSDWKAQQRSNPFTRASENRNDWAAFPVKTCFRSFFLFFQLFFLLHGRTMTGYKAVD